MFAGLLIVSAGCLSSTPPQSTLETSTTATTSLSYPGGEKAAKIIFKVIDNTPGSMGSFDSFPSSGTAPAEFSGFAARRVYRPDNTVLSSFPSWLKGLEVGISGEGNTAAPNDTRCARFAMAEEMNLTNCIFGGGNDKVCAAPGSYYRVSERDCSSATTANGDGRATDGIYIRTFFNRDTSVLAAHENILAVVEYSATSFHKYQNDPKSCLDTTSGTFSMDNCSDFIWKTFLRPTTNPYSPPATPPQPFMFLIPRMTGYVETATLKTGGEVQSKQFVLPLASDASLSVFQISRIKSRLKQADLGAAWNTFTATCGESSPFCAGTVFYSITFYRI